MDFDTDEAYWVGVADDKSDNAKAFFSRRAVINRRKTEIEGHPVTETHEMIRIVIPGDDKSVIGPRRVSDEDKKRFSEAYARFAAKGEKMGNGLPLREWPYLTREWVAKLEYLNIHTVEEIRDASDSTAEQMGPGSRDLIKRAGEFLTPASENEQNWRKEKKEMESKIADLNAKIEQMLNAPPVEKRGPGRPRKDAA